MKKTLYVGCGLTQAPSAFIEEVDALKHHLRWRDLFIVTDFMGLTAGTPADVYRRDIEECLARCDLFLAICDYPSTGLGFELATALLVYRKPTLAVAHRDAKVSRLVIGIPSPYFRFERYQSLSGDVCPMLERYRLAP